MAVLRHRYASLTPREREVMAHVVAGRLNKQIAGDLGTSEQTIKVHRARSWRRWPSLRWLTWFVPGNDWASGNAHRRSIELRSNTRRAAPVSSSPM
jgi:hypothetical protein